jgi:FtsP/CotA-like multicopper oxidase with cupredoxin domain
VIEAREGDTVVIHVVNDSPYNVTIHWHANLDPMATDDKSTDINGGYRGGVDNHR